MTLSPRLISIVQWAFRILLGGILIFAGILKLQDNTALFETIAYISWLPIWLKWQIVEFLPWLEIITGLLLFLRPADRVGLPMAAIFYTAFFLFAIYGFATGMEGDCGCFGEYGSSTFGWGMTIRNALFVAMTGFLFYKPGIDDASLHSRPPESDLPPDEQPAPNPAPAGHSGRP